MLIIKLALLVSMMIAGELGSSTQVQVAQPNNLGAKGASELKPAEFTACPLPIPNCIPEDYFDFKTCRCVPRP